jgi:hypothetical protein
MSVMELAVDIIGLRDRTAQATTGEVELAWQARVVKARAQLREYSIVELEKARKRLSAIANDASNPGAAIAARAFSEVAQAIKDKK